MLFDPAAYQIKSITMPDGTVVEFKAYEKLFYVSNIEDENYQYLNYYIPLKLKTDKPPILLRTYIGGYFAGRANDPSPLDATGRALKEGYVVCIPGSRGSNSTIVDEQGKTVYTGRIPGGLIDLKAAIRCLRLNRDKIVGDTEKIIIDGTSAGGAMSSLVGSTGNHPVYEEYLTKIGAAKERDDVFASVCYCPITDLDHADMAYEWLYQVTDARKNVADEEQKKISQELASLFPSYLNSLNLKQKDGKLITVDNYMDYIKTFIIQSAQRAKNEGFDIPDDMGFKFSEDPMSMMMRNRPNSKEHDRMPPSFGPPGRVFEKRQGEFVLDVDMEKYLNYVASTKPLKTIPSFDAMNVAGNKATPENMAFGDAEGNSFNFTEFHREISDEMKQRVFMMNPMNFINDSNAVKAKHFFIRHGAKDRDTSFCVPINLATKLMNANIDVNFFLPFNRPHSGDYNLDDLFNWIENITK